MNISARLLPRTFTKHVRAVPPPLYDHNTAHKSEHKISILTQSSFLFHSLTFLPSRHVLQPLLRFHRDLFRCGKCNLNHSLMRARCVFFSMILGWIHHSRLFSTPSPLNPSLISLIWESVFVLSIFIVYLCGCNEVPVHRCSNMRSRLSLDFRERVDNQRGQR